MSVSVGATRMNFRLDVLPMNSRRLYSSTLRYSLIDIRFKLRFGPFDGDLAARLAVVPSLWPQNHNSTVTGSVNAPGSGMYTAVILNGLSVLSVAPFSRSMSSYSFMSDLIAVRVSVAAASFGVTFGSSLGMSSPASDVAARRAAQRSQGPKADSRLGTRRGPINKSANR